MTRKEFIFTLMGIPVTSAACKLKDLEYTTSSMPESELMPVLFLGHGSPMNAIEENEFVSGFRAIAKTLPTPTAILCISAHWYTRGTFVTAMEKPRTIHDFGGFPQQLFQVQYPAKGDPALAKNVKNAITKATIIEDHEWGLDHGAWSVIKHLYPNADIPVVQLSIDYTKPASYHFELAEQLKGLRKKGILIIGSGNIVHNLGLVDFARINDVGFGFDWAIEAREKINNLLVNGDFKPIIEYEKLGKAVGLAAPSPDHFLPLIYSLALKNDKEEVSLFNDKLLAGSLSMTSLKIA